MSLTAGWNGVARFDREGQTGRGAHHVLSPTAESDRPCPRDLDLLSEIEMMKCYEAYHVLPSVLFPLDSARRRN